MSAASALRTSAARLLKQPSAIRTQTRCLRQIHTDSSPLWRHRFARPLQGRRTFNQRRNASSFADGAKSLFKEYPISTISAFAAILLGSFGLIYANYIYQSYIIGAFHNYPEPVAQKLRRALYFTNSDLQPREAIKYYKQALQVAAELGMDQFSDEIMGIKIQVASLMEKIEQYSKAIQVLEICRRDSLEWVEKYSDKEENKKQRTRVLQKCVGMSIKLGELYGQPVIYNRDAAEERLVWAVETVLKERQRRDALNVSEDDEGAWLSDSEIGAALESLAHAYEDKDQHYLATPLFLQALGLHPPKTCHAVVLMNNLASSLAQQSPRAAKAAQAYAESRNLSSQQPSPSATPPATRESMIENARTWAQKALDVAAGIRPPERDEDCDVGCAVATHNLGEFAEMQKDFREARRRYEEAVGLARAIGFQEGVEMSSERLRGLKGSS